METEKNKVFVTGMGIVSALGIGIQDNLDKLISGKTGIGAIQFLQTRARSLKYAHA